MVLQTIGTAGNGSRLMAIAVAAMGAKNNGDTFGVTEMGATAAAPITRTPTPDNSFRP